jgi:hypothetical protein
MELSPESEELFKKIEAGIQLAGRRLYEERAAKNESVIVYKNGKVMKLPARELLKEMDEKKGGRVKNTRVSFP